MLNLKRSISESTIDALSIVAKGVQHSNIDGRIKNCDGKYVFIRVTNGFKILSTLVTNMMQVFDINFRINQTPYQLQLQALDKMAEHKLFSTLINNPLYNDDKMAQEYSHIQNELK